MATAPERDRSLRVTFAPKGEGWTVSGASRTVDEAGAPLEPHWQENFEAEVYWASRREERTLDLEGLRRGATRRLDLDAAYEYARRLGIHHGGFMKAEGEIFEGDGWLLARLSLSALAADSRDSFALHPVFLDGATLVPFLFAYDNPDGNQPFIPLCLESLEVNGPAPSECWVHVERGRMDLSSRDVVHTDLDLYTPEGRLWLAFGRLSAKRIRDPERMGRAAPGGPVADSERMRPTPQAGPDGESLRARIEDELCVLLAEPLGKTAAEVQRDVGFYDQGLDSVQLLGVARRLETRIGEPLYPTLLFEYPSVRALARYLEDRYASRFAAEAWPVEAARAEPESMVVAASAKDLVVARPGWYARASTGAAGAPAACLVWAASGPRSDVAARLPGSELVWVTPGASFRETAAGFEIDPYRKDDFRRVWQALAARGPLPRRLLHLGTQANDADIVAQLGEQAFSALRLCRAWVQLGSPDPLTFLHLIERAPDEHRPAEEALVPLLRSVHLENRRFSGRVVELVGAPAAERLDALFDEDQPHLRWEGGQWLERRWTEVAPPVEQAAWKPGGVYVITGGGGGLGWLTAKHLARTVRARLVLVSRTAPGEGAPEKLRALETLGAEVLPIAADVARRSETERVVKLARERFGAIDGVLHAAGVRRDALLSRKTDADAAEVLAPKVQGLVHLDEATRSEPLHVFMAFSSIAGAVGNPGQSDYAYANGFMDAFMEARDARRAAGERHGHSVSINWPLWAQGGMSVDAEIATLLRTTFGMAPLETEAGLKLMDAASAGASGRLMVVQGEARRLRRALGLGGPPAALPAKDRPEEPREERVVVGSGRSNDEVAIIGLSGRYPQAGNLRAFWRNLREGRDCITEVPAARWDHEAIYNPDRGREGAVYAKWGGFIDDVDKFDGRFFNVAPREAELMDPQERLFLETSWHAIEDAGYTRAALERSTVGVFVGVMWNQYQMLGADGAGDGMAPSSFAASIANRVSYVLGLRGPSLAVDTMCSSSLTAIHLACRSLAAGECDYAIAGGVNLTLHPHKYRFLSFGQFLSSDGRCRSFGAGGDGYVPGEGVGAVLFKRLSDAIADGDRIEAVIKATAINHGGRTSGYTVPRPQAQSSVIRGAFARAGIEPNSIQYIEAHGTGTSLGDPIEIAGLQEVFQSGPAGTCAIGSVKSNIGHLEAAAGIAALTKVVLQLRHGELVPSLHAERLNPQIAFDKSRFRVQRACGPWSAEGGAPRRAGVSSFGAGGANAHVVIEEGPRSRPGAGDGGGGARPPALFVLSARTEERLRAYATEMAAFLADPGGWEPLDLVDVAYTSQVGREPLAERLAMVVSSVEELTQKLAAFGVGGSPVAGINRGRVRTDRTRAEGEAGGRPGAGAPDWEALGRAWVGGDGIAWSSLHGPGRRRVSLPGYPFARERHWLAVGEPSRPSPQRPGEHPLLGRDQSDSSETRYSLTLTGTEPFLVDHRVAEAPVLPGVIALEMARAAGERAGGKPVTRLAGVTWPEPLRMSLGPREVHLTLRPDGDRMTFRLYSDDNGECRVHAQGTLELGAMPAPRARTDVEALKASLKGTLGAPAFYGRFAEAQFQYGPAFRAVREVFYDGQQSLAWLEHPAPPGPAFGLVPALVDGALQSVAPLVESTAGRLWLPAAIERLTIFGALPPSVWAHARLLEEHGNEKVFSVALLDRSGVPLVEVERFSLRAPAGAAAVQSVAAPPTAGARSSPDLADRVQVVLASLISGVLKLREQDIDLEEDMSEYGFDSITLTRLANRINERFRLEITPPVFFEHKTIASFARYLCQEHGGILAATLGGAETPPIAATPVVVATPAPQREVVEVAAAPPAAEPIAIVGMAGVFPQATDLEELWAHLDAGRSLVTEVPQDRWSWRACWGDPATSAGKTDIKYGAFMKEVDKFDPGFFGISPREAELMDPQQRLFLETVWKALENAGENPTDLAGTDAGLFVGVGSLDYNELVRESGLDVGFYTATGLAHSVLANRISYLLDLRGPSEPVDTACSSSLVALHRAVESIRRGECRLAIAGGVNVMLCPTLHIAFNKAGMLAPDGRCKTFDKAADGYVRGEGVGAVVLKPLSRALADGNPIHALVRGTAANHGGHTSSLTVPNPNAQADLIVAAHERAGVDPATITCWEAHGTGTALGDPTELNAMKKAFERLYAAWGRSAPDAPHCAVGSIKTNIGHLESAAGIAGLLKVVLAMRAGIIPASLHVEELNPYIKLAGSPFSIARQRTVWSRPADADGREVPRRAGVSSFGFGGVNAHAVLEEFVAGTAPERSAGPALVVLSAKNRDRLMALARILAGHVRRTRPSLAELAYTLQVGRAAMDERMAFIAGSVEEVADALDRFSAGEALEGRVFQGNRRSVDGAARPPEPDAASWEDPGNWPAFAAFWAAGGTVAWKTLPRAACNRLALPTYPFERKRFWFDSYRQGEVAVNPARPAGAPTESHDELMNELLRQVEAGELTVDEAMILERAAAPASQREEREGSWS